MFVTHMQAGILSSILGLYEPFTDPNSDTYISVLRNCQGPVDTDQLTQRVERS